MLWTLESVKLGDFLLILFIPPYSFKLLLCYLSQMEKIYENTVAMDSNSSQIINFVPIIRSGKWSNILVCIAGLANKFGPIIWIDILFLSMK